MAKPHRFKNDLAKLAGSLSIYDKSRTECSALLHDHQNFDLWFNFTFTVWCILL